MNSLIVLTVGQLNTWNNFDSNSDAEYEIMLTNLRDETAFQKNKDTKWTIINNSF